MAFAQVARTSRCPRRCAEPEPDLVCRGGTSAACCVSKAASKASAPPEAASALVSLAEALSAEHGIECKLQFSLKRGYHLNVPRRAPSAS